MNIGIIGIGNWGRRVLNEYIELANDGIIDNVGICDKRKDVLNKFVDKVSIASNDYKKFLSSENIDGVHICVNNDMHYAMAKEALQNGKHVLLEKPMTTNSSQAYELIEISAHNGLILQVGHIFRFANVIRKAKKLVDENYFGNIYYMTMKWTTLMKPLNVDIVWDLLPHPLDIVHFLTNKYPYDWHIMKKSVSGKTKLGEVAIINLVYDDFIANVELSWITPERKRLLEIIGDEKMAKIECVKQKMHIFEKDNDFDVEVESNNTIRDEALNFIESIKNKKMAFNSHIIGARNVTIIERMMKKR